MKTPTDIELDILAALAEGMTNKQIASRRHMTKSAVGMTLMRLRQRVGAETTVELVAMALRNRWIA